MTASGEADLLARVEPHPQRKNGICSFLLSAAPVRDLEIRGSSSLFLDAAISSAALLQTTARPDLWLAKRAPRLCSKRSHQDREVLRRPADHCQRRPSLQECRGPAMKGATAACHADSLFGTCATAAMWPRRFEHCDRRAPCEGSLRPRRRSFLSPSRATVPSPKPGSELAEQDHEPGECSCWPAASVSPSGA